MTDQAPATPAPRPARRWLIRAGVAKASPAEVPWLIAELDGADDRAVRRRWGAPVMLAAAGVLLVTAILVSVVGDAGLPALTWGPLLGTLFGAAIGAVWAPVSGFRRRRRVVLRLHGLDETGSPAPKPSWSARLSPLGWSAVQAVGFVIAITVLTAAALVWLRPWAVTVTTCDVQGNQLVASGVVDQTGRGYERPQIEWLRPHDGSVIGSSAILSAPGEFLVWFPLLDAPAPAEVTCKVG